MRIFLPLLLSIAPLHAIDMTDYRTIYGRYDEAYINGAFQATTGNQEQVGYDLSLEANTRTIYTTAPYSFEFITKGGTSFSQAEDKNSSNSEAYELLSSTRYDKYLDYHNLFIYSSSDIGYRKEKSSEEADEPLVKIGLGAGYGRVFDATPLAVALRVTEELQRYGVIMRELSDIYLLKLAKIIGTQDNYIGKYGTENYRKYWFSDMERLFKEAKVSYQEHLGAVGILKMEEVIEIEKISGRFHGWKVRTGVGQVLSSYDGESESTTVDAEFAYGLPMGYEAQYIENALLSKNLDESKPVDFIFDNTMSYTYEITDLIDWENSWALNIEKYHEGEDVIKNSISTGFRYYLANNLTIDSTFTFSKTDGTNGNTIETEDWDGDFFVGVRYRLK